MNATIIIALNTFKENIRNKVLYNILLFALGIILLSISFGDWSVFARVQVMEDFGLATMSIAGLLLAVFIGVGLLGKEISQKTLYTVLVRPVNRFQFILGKFTGLLVTLFINFGIMTLVFSAVLVYQGGTIELPLLSAVFLAWVELAVIVSVSILFSVFTTPTLAAIFTIAFWIIGHYNDLVQIKDVQADSPAFALLLKAIYYVLPNLEHFNIRAPVIYGNGIEPGFVVLAVIYGLLYTTLFLLLATLVFSRKDV